MIIEIICVVGISVCIIIIRYSYKYYINYNKKKRYNEFLKNIQSSQIYAEL